MTGGTLLVKLGTLYSFTKVAHDGYDLEDFAALIKNSDLSSETPQDICLKYLKFRQKNGRFDFDPFNPVSSVDDRKWCIVSDTYVKPTQFEEVLSCLEDALNSEIEEGNYDEEHPYYQLTCSYCDYMLFIDLDDKSILLNNEEL